MFCDIKHPTVDLQKATTGFFMCNKSANEQEPSRYGNHLEAHYVKSNFSSWRCVFVLVSSSCLFLLLASIAKAYGYMCWRMYRPGTDNNPFVQMNRVRDK